MACLLDFFLDFLTTIPVSLFLGSTCFPEGPFLPPREATDVAAAPCLATSRQFGRNKSINKFNASLSEAILKHKQDIMPDRETHRSISDGLFVQSVVYPCGKVHYLLTSDVNESVQEKLVGLIETG